MTEQDPTTISAPAPWALQGSAYVCFLRQSDSLALLMFVEYRESPVGPYHELLYIPGRVQFVDGKEHFSISRIFVSSMASVLNGRKNWGIPKELAEFEVIYEQKMDHIIVKNEDKTIVELSFRFWSLPLPFSTILLPTSWTTLAQYDGQKTYIFSPKASGWLQPARLESVHVNPTDFPLIDTRQVVTTLRISHFKMFFPVAKVLVGIKP